MRAAVGDRLLIRGPHVGDHERSALVLAVDGPDGGPPYVVRWDDDGHESTFFPGPDAEVHPHPAEQA